MARGRATPYTAQLKRYLDSLDPASAAPFSAAKLEKDFVHRRKPTLAVRIAGIHKALVRAFAAGELITFEDESGAVMREPERLVPGSKAVAQPQIFALPGTPSPDAAYRPVTHGDTVRRDVGSNGLGGSDPSAAAADERPAGTVGPEPHAASNGRRERGDEGGAGSPPITPDEARTRIAAYVDAPPPTAPAWVPASALRVWVALAPAAVHWRSRLDQAQPTERIQLIQAGVSRKIDITADSYAARGIAALCRQHAPFWPDLVPLVATHYGELGDDELAEFAADPTTFYLDSDRDAFVLLFLGLVMGLSENSLRDIAQACDDAVESESLGVNSDRLSELEAELNEARRALKHLGKELKAGKREREQLESQLDAARMAQSRQAREGALGKERAHRERLQAELATAQRELQQLRSAKGRVRELDGEVTRLEKELATSRTAAEKERRRRAQAESQLREQQEELEALRERARAAEDAASMPVDDPVALVNALAGPVGEAAGRAGARLAAGATSRDDERLMGIARALMQALRETGDSGRRLSELAGDTR